MDESTYPASAGVARKIRGLMGENMTSQKGLAAVLGISQPAISRRLKGRQEWSIDELLQVAEHFDVPITDLFSDRGIFRTPCFDNSVELAGVLVDA